MIIFIIILSYASLFLFFYGLFVESDREEGFVLLARVFNNNLILKNRWVWIEQKPADQVIHFIFSFSPIFYYADLRTLKKNMIYCSGLPSVLTEPELQSNAYFGQYGQIEKIIITPFPNRNYCSVYITYSHEFEAALAILVKIYIHSRLVISSKSNVAPFGVFLVPWSIADSSWERLNARTCKIVHICTCWIKRMKLK